MAWPRTSHGIAFGLMLLLLGGLIYSDVLVNALHQTSISPASARRVDAAGVVSVRTYQAPVGSLLKVDAEVPLEVPVAESEFFIVESGEGKAFLANQTPA